MKKLLSLVLAALMVFALTANMAFAADTMTISAENVEITEGTATADVTISISDNPGIATFGFDVGYDADAMTVKSWSTTGNIFAESEIESNLTKNPFIISAYTGKANKTNNGEFVTLTFEIKEGTPAGKYDITLSENKKLGGALNIDGEDVPYTLVNGSVTVTEKPKEDIKDVTLADAEYTYDGSPKSLVVKGKLPEGAKVAYENNEKTDAGIYDVTAKITAPGYNDKVLSSKLTIKKRELAVTGLKAENKTYDGTKNAVITGGTLTGAVKGDDVAAAIPKEGTFAKADAAKGIAVSIGEITLSGEKAKNYTLTRPAALKAGISKAALTVKANDLYIVKGQKVTLTYTLTGELFGDDKLTGELSTKADGSKTGEFAITQGTLKATANYELKFEGGKVYVSDKKPQNIAVSELGEKTYGDAAVKITVTPDADSKLSDFTFESDNKDVAEVSADGTVTIKAAGEANITVKQAGNEEYAPFAGTLKLTVNKKAVTVTEIKLDDKTAVLSGVLEADAEVKLDFDALVITLGDAVDETTSNAVVTGFTLAGARSENYTVTTESIATTVKNENTVTITATADKGTVTGTGTYLKGAKVTLTAAANSGYRFTGWYAGETIVSDKAEYSFTAEKDTELTAKFKKKSSGGGSSSSGTYTVKFETNGGSDVASVKIKKGQKIGEIEEPKKEGFVFTGWYSDKALTEKYGENEEVKGSITLYAGWKIDPKRQIVLAVGKKNAEVFGEKKSNDVAPVIKNERTMLPARFVAEALGAKVEWNEEAKTVTITKDKTVIVITIDSDKATVSGKEVKLDSPAFIENSRTYTPIRFISEALGATVEWNEKTEEVTITK